MIDEASEGERCSMAAPQERTAECARPTIKYPASKTIQYNLNLYNPPVQKVLGSVKRVVKGQKEPFLRFFGSFHLRKDKSFTEKHALLAEA